MILDPFKLTLYNFEWQALRTSLDFSTLETTEKCIKKLSDYLGDQENVNKVWRVLNLLSATRMGFSGQRTLLKDNGRLADLENRDELIKAFRERLSKKFADLDKTKIEPDSRSSMVDDLHKASEEDFNRVYKSLQSRYDKSGESVNRPELAFYLKLMESIK
jgi:hypothetical protein